MPKKTIDHSFYFNTTIVAAIAIAIVMTATDPGSVANICKDLQELATQMLELRCAHNVFPKAPATSDDEESAMDVDPYEVPPFVMSFCFITHSYFADKAFRPTARSETTKARNLTGRHL